MPNWCMNTLTVIAKPENFDDLNDMQNQVIGDKVDDDSKVTYFSLEKILPTPEDAYDLNMIKNGFPDWYNWHSENWGTKWDVDCQQSMSFIIDGNKILKYEFDSAWAPPIEAIDILAGHYPQLFFHLFFDEPGMDFSGVRIWRKGEVYEDYDWQVSFSNMKYTSDAKYLMSDYPELITGDSIA